MPDEELYYNDLDLETIYGDSSVGDSEDNEQEYDNEMRKIFTYRHIYVGTVTKLNKDTLTVDIKHGEAKDDSGKEIKNREFKDCAILGLGGQNTSNEFFGTAFLPKEGSRVVYTFLVGEESQPIVLGTLLVAKNVQGVGEAKGEVGATGADEYYRNGKLYIWRKYTGDLVVKNDKVEFELLNTGDIKLKNASTTVSIKADGSIELGTSALEPLVLGTAFKTLYNAHTHPTPAGPSSAPVVPMGVGQLSQKATVK